MSLHCINPYVFQGDPGDPPEYVSDNEDPCGACGEMVDLDDEVFTLMDDGSIRCKQCSDTCYGCGEIITDPDPIMLRCPSSDRLEAYCTPECAGEEL